MCIFKHSWRNKHMYTESIVQLCMDDSEELECLMSCKVD